MNIRETGYNHTTVSGEARMGILALMTSVDHRANVSITLGKLCPYSDLWFLEVVLAITFVCTGKLCVC